MSALQASEKDLADKLLQALIEALEALPQVRAQQPIVESRRFGERFRLDAELQIDVADRPVTLLIEVKKSVYPRDVRQILWQLRQFGALDRLTGQENAAVALLAAESISPGAKDLLRQENVGYYDSGGSLFIPARGAYVFIDKPPPRTLEKTVGTLFQGKRSHVLHTLLIHHGEWFRVKDIAELAEVSPATASETLSALERFDWLNSRGKGPTKERCLTQPGGLLDEWARRIADGPKLETRRFYISHTDADSLMRRLAESCIAAGVEYVITMEAAAQRYAPFLSSISQVACRLAQSRAADAALKKIDARAVDEGANLIVIEPASQGEFLFAEEVDGVQLASPVQVYLDLLRGKGRAKEMAGHLRQERIGY